MNQQYLSLSDEEIIVLIRSQDDKAAFQELYERYFRVLFNYAYSKINDEFSAQEIVQELFVNLWQQRYRNEILSCRPYLFAVVKKLIISYYRKEHTRQHHYSQWGIYRSDESTVTTDQEAITSDLRNRYEEGLHLLPPKCREVFVLSRQGLSNKEIALQLVISEKTVEQHITKALRILRSYLREHLPYLIIFLQLLS
ncbi:hypothetical protein DYBT9275_01411 [Dyadobacter sp. CECT 9275]|uniref:HTH luxR-type domain-containing protein n=1 Tax=Dyadobacter helix TaxID=2822344 RepID=A0A916JB72_9BACT|nr:RNA polymerase sigma-70 factor [Dyadobacter sp. CECT 9275]CAG4994525.1 hypothetical protein DYBT9275_01411 [Dyadobacter sp. CECT 9275]